MISVRNLSMNLPKVEALKNINLKYENLIYCQRSNITYKTFPIKIKVHLLKKEDILSKIPQLHLRRRKRPLGGGIGVMR